MSEHEWLTRLIRKKLELSDLLVERLPGEVRPAVEEARNALLRAVHEATAAYADGTASGSDLSSRPGRKGSGGAGSVPWTSRSTKIRETERKPRRMRCASSRSSSFFRTVLVGNSHTA